MTELTTRRVVELNEPLPPGAHVLAVADHDGVGIALIDATGDGTRILASHYVKDAHGQWQPAHPPRPAAIARFCPSPPNPIRPRARHSGRKWPRNERKDRIVIADDEPPQGGSDLPGSGDH